MSNFIAKQVFLPDDTIIDIKAFCLKQAKKTKESYKVFQFVEHALEYLSNKKQKKYYASFTYDGEGISAFLVRFRRSYDTILQLCVHKAAMDAGEEISERRVLLTAILLFLQKQGINTKGAIYG